LKWPAPTASVCSQTSRAAVNVAATTGFQTGEFHVLRGLFHLHLARLDDLEARTELVE
jgi:hypothetical protein